METTGKRENQLRHLDHRFISTIHLGLMFLFLLIFTARADSQNSRDWLTGLRREPILLQKWPTGKKVAVCFILYVEVWGSGKGPNLRPDTATRDPDVVNESFRQYAINSGVPRVGMIFSEEGQPLSIALNALYPSQYPDAWKEFRSLVPKAPIIAHGINNSTELLPLDKGVNEQETYIRRTLDLIERATGVRP